MLYAPDRRDRRADRAALATTLGTLGTYLDRQDFDRTGLLVLFDEAGLTITGRCAAEHGAWATRALTLADLAAPPARRTGLFRRARPGPLAALLQAVGGLLDERCYLRRGLTLQFGREVVLVGGLALTDGGVATPYGHEAALTLLLDDGALAPYRAEL